MALYKYGGPSDNSTSDLKPVGITEFEILKASHKQVFFVMFFFFLSLRAQILDFSGKMMRKPLHGMNNWQRNIIPISIANSQYVISNTTNPATYVQISLPTPFLFPNYRSLNVSSHYVGEPKKRSFQVLERRRAEIHDANTIFHPVSKANILNPH